MFRITPDSSKILPFSAFGLFAVESGEWIWPGHPGSGIGTCFAVRMAQNFPSAGVFADRIRRQSGEGFPFQPDSGGYYPLPFPSVCLDRISLRLLTGNGAERCNLEHRLHPLQFGRFADLHTAARLLRPGED